MAYAASTSVPVERSRAEIERMLQKYGCTRFVSGWDGKTANVAFEAHDRRVRFSIPIPQLVDFATSPKGQKRNPRDQKAAHEQEMRRRWRSIALVMKAKLEAVASGVSTFEEEFLAFILMPSNETVGEWLAPLIDNAYSNKKMPPLLGSGLR